MQNQISNKSSWLILFVSIALFAFSLFIKGFSILIYASVIVLGAWMVYLAISTDFLRDNAKIEGGRKPFSFSRVQLAYWSFLVIGGYMIIYVLKNPIEILNETGLILLGIGGATTTSASLIDASDKSKGAESEGHSRHQDTASEGFFSDIMSDADGISIHRLQAVVFNLIYGIILIFSVLTTHQLPEFSQNVLILLGLSSGTYVVLKAGENK